MIVGDGPLSLKLMTICAVMGGFAFGFSELVSHAHQNMPAESAYLTCQNGTGPGCNPLLDN